MSVVLNAVVTQAYVGLGGYEDQILSLYVMVEFEGGGSLLVEGWRIGIPPMDSKSYVADTPLGEVILQWLKTTGAQVVDDMVGKPLRIRMARECGEAGDIEAVGHFVRNEWFSTKAIYDEWLERRKVA
jgi:hypothetical protein